MTEHIEGFSREQVILLPDRLDDYVGEENPVRFVDVFVDGLDLKGLGFKRVEPEETGRPPYDPADLLKLYVYGYLNQARSSRKLERECARNVEVMWLMKRLAPDLPYRISGRTTSIASSLSSRSSSTSADHSTSSVQSSSP